MLDWTDEHKMLRDAIRSFVEKEIVPLRDELEHGDLPPYDVLRKLFTAFGIDEMARDGFQKRLERETSHHERRRPRLGRRRPRRASIRR